MNTASAKATTTQPVSLSSASPLSIQAQAVLKAPRRRSSEGHITLFRRLIDAALSLDLGGSEKVHPAESTPPASAGAGSSDPSLAAILAALAKGDSSSALAAQGNLEGSLSADVLSMLGAVPPVVGQPSVLAANPVAQLASSLSQADSNPAKPLPPVRHWVHNSLQRRKKAHKSKPKHATATSAPKTASATKSDDPVGFIGIFFR